MAVTIRGMAQGLGGPNAQSVYKHHRCGSDKVAAMKPQHISTLSSKRVIAEAEKGKALESERFYREAQYFALKSQSDPDADHEYVKHMLEAAQGAILIHLPQSRIARDLKG